ncbi:MAG: methionine adenosyltransferase domain-containing protein [Mollicutes bacterium]|nr:MAG: methionine adenosyltransferase domain-containing protein [Mollicutes bacterium]
MNFDFFLTPFFKGGPIADTGLTGRKIAVDNYGTCVRNGGGSFAGKDVTKSDRTLALFARFIAKNIVKLNLTSEIEIQITSRIGQTKNFFIGYSTKKGEKIKINKIIRYFSS